MRPPATIRRAVATLEASIACTEAAGVRTPLDVLATLEALRWALGAENAIGELLDGLAEIVREQVGRN